MPFDSQHVASRLRSALRISTAVEAKPQRLLAGVGDLQRRQLVAGQVAGLRFIAGERFGLHGGLRLPAAGTVLQRTPGQEQSITLLRRKPALAVCLFRQIAEQRILRFRQQFILLQQRQLQRIVAQLAAVIAEPAFRILARRGHRQLQGLVAARRIAHQFQGDAQLQQRQTGTRLVVTTPDLAQRAERRFLLPGQHQRGIGLSGKAAGLGIIAIADGHQPRLL